MKNLLLGLFRPAIMNDIPGGLVPDKTADLGNLGFMANANKYAAAMASYATTAAPTITGADLVKGVVQLNTGAGGAYAINLDTTPNILTALGNTIPTAGNFWKPLFFVNNGSGQTGTVTAGDAMTTVIGTATVANNSTRMMMMRVLGSTLQISNVGSLTL